MRNTVLVKALVALVLAIIVLTGCTVERDGQENVDRTGRTFVLNRPINRIVSTAPSNTELIVDLGMAHKLIAIDRHSENIVGVPDGLPLVDFFFPDVEALINLHPDVIIASGINTTGSGEDPFQMLREMGIAVVYISMSDSIEEIYNDIYFLAGLLGVPENGQELIRTTRAHIDEIRRIAAGIENKLTVYFEIGALPNMVTFGRDSFLNDMITTIGAINIFANDNWVLSPSAEVIISRNPDVILTNVPYLEDPVAEIKQRPGFNHINAVINNRVYRIDTNSSSRSNARIVYALRQMVEAVYPEVNLDMVSYRTNDSQLDLSGQVPGYHVQQ